MATNTRLLNRNIDSRDTAASRWRWERRRSRRKPSRAKEPITSTARNGRKYFPTGDSEKVWTEDSRPERVRNVPSTASEYVERIRATFQIFSIPRRSWIITECRNAVAVSHGSSEAFSTGSHAQ